MPTKISTISFTNIIFMNFSILICDDHRSAHVLPYNMFGEDSRPFVPSVIFHKNNVSGLILLFPTVFIFSLNHLYLSVFDQFRNIFESFLMVKHINWFLMDNGVDGIILAIDSVHERILEFLRTLFGQTS